MNSQTNGSLAQTELPSGTVTFLFTDIEGSTELLKQLGEQYASLLAEQRSLLREVFARWNGQQVDTQGDAFFYSFPRATEAVNASVEAQKRLAEHPWSEGAEVRVRMGLHTGEPWRAEEGYVGMDVHRAARIAHAGHGQQVLLSETTTSLVRDELPEGASLLDLGRHRLKDMRRPEHLRQLVIKGLPSDFPPLRSQQMFPSEDELVDLERPAFLVEGREPVEREREVFVARERELARLEEALEAAVAGQGGAMFIVGNAGRGKTALLREFMRRAEEKIPDQLVVSGTCNMLTGMGDPYLPFRQILELLTGEVERDWLAGWYTTEMARRLWTQLLNTAYELLEGAPDLVNRLVSGSALAARVRAAGGTTQSWWPRMHQLVKQEKSGTDDLEQAFLFEQCSRFLRRVSQNAPLLLVLDDLHWGDAASIGMLFHLGRSIAASRILLVGAYRPDEVATGRVSSVTSQTEPHPLGSVVSELTLVHGMITLDLGQEDSEEERAFVEAFLDTEPNDLDEEFREALTERAGGHPLFTIELLLAMQERGELVQSEQGRWTLGAELNWEDLPARVEAVIAERVGRLDEELREMISVASVEGEEFTAQVVARVRQAPELPALRVLAEQAGRRHRIVVERGEVQTGSHLLSRYQFAHQLFQRYLYNRLDQAERRILHGQIAEVLEHLYRERTDDIVVELAYHYQEARNDEKALEYLILAADYASDRYANDDAERYYRAALERTSDDQQRARVLRDLGRILDRLGQETEAIAIWAQAIRLYHSMGDWDAVAWLYARSARATAGALGLGDWSGALRICLEGLRTVPAEFDSAAMAALLHEAGRVYLFNGMSDEALQFCNSALEMAERFESTEVLADALATRGLMDDLNPEEAIQLLKRSVELADSAGLHRIASRAHNNLATALGEAVSLSEDRKHGHRCVEISRARGDLMGQTQSLHGFAMVSMEMGELGVADRAIAEAKQLQAALGPLPPELDRARALRMVFSGDLKEAIDRLHGIRTYHAEGRDPYLEFIYSVRLADALCELHDFNKAIQVLEETVRRSDSPFRIWKVIALATLCRLYCLVGEVSRAREALEQVQSIGGPEWYALEEAHLSWATARFSAAEGDWPNALRSFEAADDLFKQLGNLWGQSRLIRDWAEAYVHRGQEGDADRARDLFEQVRAMYEEISMPFFVEKVAERLRSLPGD